MPVENQPNSSVDLSNLDLAKFLLNSDVLTSELQKFGITRGDALTTVITHLDSIVSWNAYKADIEKQCKQAENDVLKLSTQIGDLFYTVDQKPSERDSITKMKADLEAQSSKRYAEMKVFAAQKALFSGVDLLINNNRMQTRLFARMELARYYPEYIKTDAAYRDAVKNNNQDKQQEISDAIVEVIKHDHHLGDLLKTIALLEKELHAAKHDNHHEHESALEQALEVTETLTEFSESATELADITSEWADFVKESSHMGEEGGAKEAVKEGSKAAQGIRAIPLISEFIYGLNCLKEAYSAYKNPHEGQRKTKIMAGVVGGLASIGAGIVGSLLLAGVGALATAAAVFAAPIVLAAIAVGIYAVALYRDAYVYQQSKLKFEKAQNELNVMENELFRAKEIIISNHLNHSNDPNLTEIKKLQDTINQDRSHLYSEMHGNKNQTEIMAIKNRLNDNVLKRNKLMGNVPGLNDKLTAIIREDSRVIRLRLERSRLSNVVTNLQQARFTAGTQAGLSAVTIIGVSLALAAVCATGIGALVVGLIAATVLTGLAIVRVHDAIIKKSKASVKSDKTVKLPEESIHSSELGIEKKLLHDHHEEIAHALIHQSVEQPSKPKVVKSNVVSIESATPTPVKSDFFDNNKRTDPRPGGH